jgi:tetratricopeptide (TPR) repeat protein
MASRINVKFVIFLTIGITLVSGMLVGAAYVVLTKSGDEYIARAQAAEAEGDYVRAAEMYGRAVGHDRTNVEWLHMWFDALVQSTPETRPEYEKSYIEHYLGILHSLATLQDRDPAVQRRYLEAVKEHNWWLNPSTDAWEDLADLTSRALDRLDQEAPEAQALRRYRGLAILNQMQLFQPADTVQDQALEDLRAAVAADSEDVESAIAIARWHLIRWQNAQNARRDQEASDYMEGLEEQRVRLEERFGQNPEARLFLLEMEIARALATSTTYAQERIAVRGLASLGVEQSLLDVMASLDAPSLSSNFYERLLRVLLVLRPEDGAEIALGIIGRGLENAPDDPELLLLNGSTLGTHVNPEEAIEVLQRLVDLPDMPVGLQGMLLRDFRVQAVAMQCENALRQWERTDPGAPSRCSMRALRSRNCASRRPSRPCSGTAPRHHKATPRCSAS